jgi:hypothetical protein
MRLRELPVLLGDLGISFPECARDECSAKCPCARNQHKAMSAALIAVACGPSPDRLPIVAAGAAVSRMPNIQASAQLRRGAGGAQGDFVLFHGQAEGAARCTWADDVAIPSDFSCPKIKQLQMGLGSCH